MQSDALFDKISLGSVHCPNCGHSFPVEPHLMENLEKKFKSGYDKRLQELSKTNENQRLDWERKQTKLVRTIETQKKHFEADLVAQKRQMAWEIKEETDKNVRTQIENLQTELKKQKSENTRLRQQEIALLKKEADLKQWEENVKLDMERSFLQMQSKWKDEIRQSIEQKHTFLHLEYEKKLADQKKLLEEMRCKMESGNNKLQGEIQEMALENYLQSIFPEDLIRPVKSGKRGADCLQIVRNNRRMECGSIYYESKRTKHFQNAWVEKLKDDMREKRADIGVLVTESMPADMERLGRMDGIWVCNFEEFKNLSLVLRDGLLRLHQVISARESNFEKSRLIFKFLASSEFRMQVEGILAGFSSLKQELEKEKRAMHGIWQRREKQIDKVLLNTNLMFNAIKGIAGGAVGDIQMLELSGD